MKKQFRAYYRPSEEELGELWSTGLIVLDTNALLNFYRYTSLTRADFTALLRSMRDRLWLPHQVGLEFHRNRLEVIDQQELAFDSIESALAKAKHLVEKELNSFRRHPSLNTHGITSALESGLNTVTETVSVSRQAFVDSPLIDDGVDTVLDALTDLFDSRMGEPFSDTELEAIYAEGTIRYESQVPPGYEDRRKPEPERYGDLVLWRQMLAKGIQVQQPVIFVTDDGKEDWWQHFKGRTIGPRIELVEEFYETTGRRIHFYSPEGFLKYAIGRGITTEISAESIGEVQQVSDEEFPARAYAVLSEQLEALQSHRSRLEHEVARLDPDLAPSSETRDEELIRLMAEVDGAKELYSQLSDQQVRIREMIVEADHPDDKRDFLRDLDRITAQRLKVRDRIVTVSKRARSMSSPTGRRESSREELRARHLRHQLEQIEAEIEKTALAVAELE
ncbi:PIN-like domain-containing protein [Leifsonia sp. YAF41]|uniref:PIN-like domain-containing protein n=1 Tax=Leifsonia sp. YAF41 TaxID=3233086 RepID=UPI003F964DB2